MYSFVYLTVIFFRMHQLPAMSQPGNPDKSNSSTSWRTAALLTAGIISLAAVLIYRVLGLDKSALTAVPVAAFDADGIRLLTARHLAAQIGRDNDVAPSSSSAWKSRSLLAAGSADDRGPSTTATTTTKKPPALDRGGGGAAHLDDLHDNMTLHRLNITSILKYVSVVAQADKTVGNMDRTFDTVKL